MLPPHKAGAPSPRFCASYTTGALAALHLQDDFGNWKPFAVGSRLGFSRLSSFGEFEVIAGADAFGELVGLEGFTVEIESAGSDDGGRECVNR